MAYRGPTQDEVDADMDSEAAIRLAEAGGDIMSVSMPIGANVAQWNGNRIAIHFKGPSHFCWVRAFAAQYTYYESPRSVNPNQWLRTCCQ